MHFPTVIGSFEVDKTGLVFHVLIFVICSIVRLKLICAGDDSKICEVTILDIRDATS